MQTVSKVLGSTWLHRLCGRIYDSLVKEDIPRGFRSYVLVMRVAGFWPTAGDLRSYKWHTIAFYVLLGMLFPLSMCVNVIFVNSIDEIMERFFYLSAICIVTYKSCIIYWRCDNIRELFRIHGSLLPEHTQHHDRVAHINKRVHFLLTLLYFMTWIAFVSQSLYTRDKSALLPSTTLLPYEFARRPAIFSSVLGYQILSCFLYSVWVASMEDSFYVALINANCGQVAELKERLMKLGTEIDGDEDRDLRFYRELLGCCKRYHECLR